MNKNYEKPYRRWKAVAIVLIIFTLVMIAFTVVALIEEKNYTDKVNTCYYDICSTYPDAWYADDVCTCYDYDVLGDLMVEKEEYIK